MCEIVHWKVKETKKTKWVTKQNIKKQFAEFRSLKSERSHFGVFYLQFALTVCVFAAVFLIEIADLFVVVEDVPSRKQEVRRLLPELGRQNAFIEILLQVSDCELFRNVETVGDTSTVVRLHNDQHFAFVLLWQWSFVFLLHGVFSEYDYYKLITMSNNVIDGLIGHKNMKHNQWNRIRNQSNFFVCFLIFWVKA